MMTISALWKQMLLGFLLTSLLHPLMYASGPPEQFHYTGQSRQLSGPWAFYWQQLYSEDTTLTRRAPDTVLMDPGTWNDYVLDGKRLEGTGFATYVLQLHADTATRVAFSLKGFYSAYRLYVNGRLVTENGQVGKSPETTSLQWVPQVSGAQLARGANQLILEVSNFQHSKGGFFHPIAVGPPGVLRAKHERNIMIDVFTAGAFLMIGVFFLGIFFTWRKDYNYLIYMLLTTSYAIRILSNGTHILKGWLTDWPWQLLVGIEYFSFYTVWWASLALIAFLFPRALYQFFNYCFIGLMVTVLLLPLHWYAHVLTPSVVIGFSCYLIALAYLLIKGKTLSRRTFWSVFIFLMLAFSGWILEFLIYAQLFDGFVALPNIFRLLAVLSLAFLISDRYTVEYEEVERLKEEAIDQKKVIEGQLSQLSEQQTLLQEHNEEIETLLKEVHHRVKNNLQLITSLLDIEDLDKAPHKAVDILEDSKSRVATMSLIHQNLYMNEKLTTIPLSDYVTDLIDNLSEIHLSGHVPDIRIHCAGFAFDVDTMMPLGLALNELITNAFKYPPENVSLYLEVRCYEVAEGEYRLTLSDHGSKLPGALSELIKTGYGLRLAYRLCEQLLGDLVHDYREGNIFTISFKDTAKRKSVL